MSKPILLVEFPTILVGSGVNEEVMRRYVKALENKLHDYHVISVWYINQASHKIKFSVLNTEYNKECTEEQLKILIDRLDAKA